MTTRPITLPKLLTIKETADHLRVCVKTVRRRIKDGEITASRVGGQLRVRERDLQSYLDRNMT